MDEKRLSEIRANVEQGLFNLGDVFALLRRSDALTARLEAADKMEKALAEVRKCGNAGARISRAASETTKAAIADYRKAKELK